MYGPFFGLHQQPFSIAPDPAFLYMSGKHRDALELLHYGLARGASFVLLTGEVGAGKTTVWRRFLERLPSNFDVASVVNPKLDVNALLVRICDDLHVALPEGADTVDLIDTLHEHLLLAHAQGRRTLIAIDEAQALSVEVLEQLRLLTNLDSTGTKLQVMLIGQPELLHMLERPALEPVAQRIVARYHLPTLSAAETASYIEHRLKVAGLDGPVPFDGEAINLIYRLCRGVPRRINSLCDRALAAAQASGRRRVDRHIVENAAAEVFGRRVVATPAPAATPAPTPINAWAVAGAAMVGFATLAWLATQFGDLPARLAGLVRTTAKPTPSAPLPASAPMTAALAAATPVAPVGTAAPVAPSPPAAADASRPSPTGIARALPAPPLAPQPAAPSPPLLDINAAFVVGSSDEALAWRALAGLWGTTLEAGEPCAAAARHTLQCFRSSSGVAMIRQLDRPIALRLVDERERVAHVLLVGLSDDSATLALAGAEVTVPLLQLARAWRGEFATFWRAPPHYRPGEFVRSDGASGAWLLKRLAEIDGLGTADTTDEALHSRIAAFQVAQGLKPDGLAGPLTLMQLNRASGVDEPRLRRASR